jgi:hypothetical protein
MPSCKLVRGGAGAASVGTTEDLGFATEDDSGRTATGAVDWSRTILGSSAKDTSGCGAEDDARGIRVSLTPIRPGETGPVEGSTGFCAWSGIAGWFEVAGMRDNACVGDNTCVGTTLGGREPDTWSSAIILGEGGTLQNLYGQFNRKRTHSMIISQISSLIIPIRS